MTAPLDAADPRVTKRRVTLRNITLDPATGTTLTTEVTDHVRPDFLDAYLADARSSWGFVGVSETPDAGRAGYDGATTIGAHLDHPLAGSYYPATGCAPCPHAPAGYTLITDPTPES